MERVDQVFLEDEVLRDGLQMESRIFSLEEKIKIFELLVEAGVPRIQVGSFVHPKLVPQMADTDVLIKELKKKPGRPLLTALILNERGLTRALDCGLEHVSMSISASDTHSKLNTNRSSAEALKEMVNLIAQAKKHGLMVRAGVQCAFGCVYEGRIAEGKVLSAAEAMVQAGADELNLADTTGMGQPRQVRSLVKMVKKNLPQVKISLHLHDTRGLGLTNMFVAYEEGVNIFDVCAGGLGGCPFIKGAAGNVPTEDAAHMFASMGVETGIDLQNLIKVVEELERILEHLLPGKMARVLKANTGE
ncbi:MAG: hydroxymethylglutaryl-CoA lyase [Thermodesulfobacteriota bacterium]